MCFCPVDIDPFNASCCCCSNRSAPYWSNPAFLIFDSRALWRQTSMAKCKALTESAVKGLKTYLLMCGSSVSRPCRLYDWSAVESPAIAPSLHQRMWRGNVLGRVCAVSVCVCVCAIPAATFESVDRRNFTIAVMVHLQSISVQFIYQGHRVKVKVTRAVCVFCYGSNFEGLTYNLYLLGAEILKNKYRQTKAYVHVVICSISVLGIRHPVVVTRVPDPVFQ